MIKISVLFVFVIVVLQAKFVLPKGINKGVTEQYDIEAPQPEKAPPAGLDGSQPEPETQPDVSIQQPQGEGQQEPNTGDQQVQQPQD